MSAVIENHHDDHHHGPAKGLTRWLYTTNHKDIGTLYLWFSFAMFLIGGAMAMVIRAELFQPGMQIVEPEFYNQMITLHGLISKFLDSSFCIFYIIVISIYGRWSTQFRLDILRASINDLCTSKCNVLYIFGSHHGSIINNGCY